MKKITTLLSIVLLFIFAATISAYALDSPAQVYQKYYNAIKNGDMNAMLNCLCTSQKAQFLQMPENQQKKYFDLIRKTQVDSYKIIRSDIKPKTAIVYMSGIENLKLNNGKKKKTKGTARLIQEDYKWKILQENWRAK